MLDVVIFHRRVRSAHALIEAGLRDAISVFHNLLVLLVNNCEIVFQGFTELVKVPLIGSNRPNHGIILLQILKLLVQEHNVKHHVRVFRSLNGDLVLPDIFRVPFENPIDVKFMNPVFVLGYELSRWRLYVFVGQGELGFSAL